MAGPVSEPIALPVVTGQGTFLARYSAAGLARLEFPGAAIPVADPEPVGIVAEWHAVASAALRAVLCGTAPAALPPLDLSVGSVFQQRVWRELLAIPSGECRTYGELARRLGSPGGSRAVGGACGANPIPVLVPCHRVLAAGGRLGGFSGGLEWKRRLLAMERGSLLFQEPG